MQRLDALRRQSSIEDLARLRAPVVTHLQVLEERLLVDDQVDIVVGRDVARVLLALLDNLIVYSSEDRSLVRAAIDDPTVKVTSSSPPGPRPVRLLARELACVAALPLQLRAVQRADQRVGRRPVGGARGR